MTEAARIRCYDLRKEQTNPAPKSRVVGGKMVLREPKLITGICVHQTAVEFGAGAKAIRDAGGDASLALARRSLKVACHALAFRDGSFAIPNDLRAYINHGNGLNAFTLGIEIDGCYSGLLDDPATVPREDLKTTWGGKPTMLTELTVETAREALRWLVEHGRAEGMPLTHIYAHRQSSPTRRSDPGEGIWRYVVLDYAVPVLGLETDPTYTLSTKAGSGRPIPVQWDPSGSGAY